MLVILARRSRKDHNNWQQLADDRTISINADGQLDWPNSGHSTQVIDVTYENNKTFVYTRSCAKYAIVFVLSGHGKAEWREAKEAAFNLACKLKQQLAA